MSNDGKVSLTLSTICEGKLEEEFQKVYPDLMAALHQGDKASVSITLDFKRVANTDTMVNVNCSFTPKYPAKKNESVCQLTNDHKLETEAPPQRPKVVNMFEGGTR